MTDTTPEFAADKPEPAGPGWITREELEAHQAEYAAQLAAQRKADWADEADRSARRTSRPAVSPRPAHPSDPQRAAAVALVEEFQARWQRRDQSLLYDPDPTGYWAIYDTPSEGTEQ